jgi:hypothetical protein
MVLRLGVFLAEIGKETKMLSVSIAVRQGGTIELQSGVFDDREAIALISSMTRSSHTEAIEIIYETRRMGRCRRPSDNFEVLATMLPVTDQADTQAA